jgi:methylthioribose-1-phosphate isomerase
VFKTIEWRDNCVVMIDQRKLPTEEVYKTCTCYEDVASAIKDMVIRGAPAIGVAAAMGIALGVQAFSEEDRALRHQKFNEMCQLFAQARPTAINLFWAIERMKKLYESIEDKSLAEIKQLMKKEALKIYEEDLTINEHIGLHGSRFVKDGNTILTHCNAGALATAGFGTALGVIRAAWQQGKKIKVFADETRPYLQGARLTTWELMKEGIPVTLITDNMAGHFMKRGKINLVIVGADRIAANGDVANKIGTYSLAVLAKEHKIPFYVAAPISTIDPECPSGEQIPIEERDSREVIYVQDKLIAPPQVKVAYPAFDITPHSYITAIITEKKVIEGNYKKEIKTLFNAHM